MKEQQLRLASIPANAYSDYRYNVIFNAYKWDPQVHDHNTISNHVVLMERKLADKLAAWAEALSKETMEMEAAFTHKVPLAKNLGLPKKLERALPLLHNYNAEENVRLMRFDFHPTEAGWAISEVNSDVPGGLAEASIFPRIAQPYFNGFAPSGSVAAHLLRAFGKKMQQGGRIALVHATAYSDDRQVMQFIGDYFETEGYEIIYAAPDHICWEAGIPYCIVEGAEGEVDGIIRFYPLEWLANLPRTVDWGGYYDCRAVSCNHPAAIFTQSKRLPLVWDELGVPLDTWKALLPETKDPREVPKENTDWIYKPALGRVGEGISIKGAVPQKEYKQIIKSARRSPKNWVAQKMFRSVPLVTEQSAFHLCVGVFTVDGKFAGFYGRVSPSVRIDDKAKDIPILVKEED